MSISEAEVGTMQNRSEDLVPSASEIVPIAASRTLPAFPFPGTGREAVARLASALDRMGGQELPVVHRFAGGMYAREVTIPAGTLLVSHVHRQDHICTCSAGAILVADLSGKASIIEAPCTVVSPAGAQRVGFALADTVWTSYHATDKRDIAELEVELYEKQEFPEYVEGDAELLAVWLRDMGRVFLLPEGGV